uniref:Uncharacterized protein n=1 Tax=Vombatus ursinus TaxID=29139 RepID=A0A4X2LYD5_VOMUR
MPLVTKRLRDPDVNPCLSFYLLNIACFACRNQMLLPDVWMKIIMTGKCVPLAS